MSHIRKQGFTLIELSIVLVIIGLIVGGVLVGRDLISAAAVRAQISQIEKYNQAVNTFRGKYGYLPGDIPDPDASKFGFVARVASAGEGDGNGLIEGIGCSVCMTGETLLFWQDLSTARLIDGSFSSVTATSSPTATTKTEVSTYIPQARINDTGNVFVYSFAGRNFFGLGNINNMPRSHSAPPYEIPYSVSVIQAYNMDKKIDDGLPTTGNVLAVTTAYYQTGAVFYLAWCMFGSNGGDWAVNSTLTPLSGGSFSPSASSCVDNNNSSSNVVQYSITANNGQGVNCDLAFRFQ